MPENAARFFDAMADDYEVLEPWYEHLYTTLHALLVAQLGPPTRPECRRALDAGCGTGFQAAVLETLGYEVHGVDLSARLLAVARRRLRRPALVLADVQALPHGDGVFDVATCCGSTLSYVDEPRAALRELGRVLRPGGRLLLECEHRWSLDIGWALVSSLAGDVLGYGLSPSAAWRPLVPPFRRTCWVDYPGCGRLRLFTWAEIRTMLSDAGLVPVRTWGIHTITNVIPSTVLHRPRLGRPLAALYRGLRALDAALVGFPPARGLANSLVVLARKAGPREKGGVSRLPAIGSAW